MHVHCKRVPWFVSDAVRADVAWLLSAMAADGAALASVAAQWRAWLADGTWCLEDDAFWTLPHAFGAMQAEAPDLYRELSGAALVVVKGDLNYRKVRR